MDPVLLHSIWSSAWRSGLSTLVVMGSMQSGNILVAQASNAVESARYLLGMRIVQAVSQVAQAPFYSKIPQLSQLHASGAFECKLRMSQHSMRLSHWLFVIVFVAVGVVGSDLLYLVGSGVAFPSPLVWSLLGLAIMGERYGAMHIQLYSTTNHIVWHVAALRHGAAFVAIALLLWPLVGLLAVPVALLVAYWGFYVPYCTRLSYAVMGSSAAAFERTVLLPPLVLMLIYVTANLIFTYI